MYLSYALYTEKICVLLVSLYANHFEHPSDLSYTPNYEDIQPSGCYRILTDDLPAKQTSEELRDEDDPPESDSAMATTQ